MNKKITEVFANVNNDVKHICINVCDFVDIIFVKNELATVVVNREMLNIGLFAHFYEKGVYVSKNVKEGFIKFSYEDNPSINEESHWTSVVPLKYVD